MLRLHIPVRQRGNRNSNHRRRLPRRLSSEVLEPRNLLATWTVTSTLDGAPGDLRTAVFNANTTPGPDIIDFTVSNVRLTLGEIAITESVYLNGATAIHVDIEAAPGSRIFFVDDAAAVQQLVSMNELTLHGGSAVGGGAILNREELHISNSTITGNTATSFGGGILNESGRVVMDQSMIYVNEASYEGGGIMNVDGALEIRDSEVRGNRVANPNGNWTFGGGIRNLGRAVSILENSIVNGNGAYASGGARAHGGGIATQLESTVHLIGSEVADNYASHEGGGLFVLDNSTLISEQHPVTGTQSRVFGNIAGEAGGGAYLLRSFADIHDTTISNNLTEFRGGGISAGNDVILNLFNTNVLTNTTNFFAPDGSGGGLYLSGFGQANGPVAMILNSLIQGNNVDPNGSPGGEFGGGISARYGTTLTLDNTQVIGNKASISGGGIYASDKFTAFSPTLTISGSTIRANEAGLQGGGIAEAGGTLDILASHIDTNIASSRGGGLFLTGLGSPNGLQTTVRDSIISGNSAITEGGGVAAGPSMSLTVERSEVNFNRTQGRGAGLYLTGLGLVYSPHVANISESVIANNAAAYDPITQSYASGGGIWGGPATLVSVDKSSVRRNQADRYGGGVMFNQATNFDLTDSTISGNRASQRGGGAYIKNADGLLQQNTWSANSAANDGGAIHLYSFLQNHVTIAHNTISLNQADSDLNGSGTGGGIAVGNGPLNDVQLDVTNTIVADNFAGSQLSLPHNDDLFDGPGQAGNPPVAAQFSLIGSRLGTTLAAANPDSQGNIVGTPLAPIDAKLGPLMNNGGTTLTMLPQFGSPLLNSPAINAADPSFVAPPTFDQRDTPFVRVANGRLDMGAVEVQSTLPGPDFNNDGNADLVDLDLLTQAIASMTYVSGLDMNGDGVLSLSDVDRWLCKAGDINLGSNLSYRYGDANLDGNVDGVDFIVWNLFKFSSSSFWSQGDFNADGFVDGIDFIQWNQNKFQGPFVCNPVPIVLPGGPVNNLDDSPIPLVRGESPRSEAGQPIVGDSFLSAFVAHRDLGLRHGQQRQSLTRRLQDGEPTSVERIVDLIFASL